VGGPAEGKATPEASFANRRAFLKSIGIVGLAGAAGLAFDAHAANDSTNFR
jgi:hypothetical protein